MGFRLAIFIMGIFSFLAKDAVSQCTNAFAFGTATAPTTTTPLTISSCTYQSEYNTINSVVAGQTYSSTNSAGGCITVHSGSPGGPVVAWGSSPLSWTATVSGTYYIHYNTNCSCGTASGCTTTTITCTSCGGGGSGCPVVAPVPNDACYQQVIASDSWCCNNSWDALCQSAYDNCSGPVTGPCTSITSIIGCGTSQSSTMTGTGSWNSSMCGFSTPGVESIWSFTPTTTGIHSINVSSVSGGFVDFAWMNSTTGCGATGWNCIADVLSPGTYGSMNWIAGQTYYILLDPEGTGSFSATFSVDCPNPTSTSAGDCAGAIPICSDDNFAVDPSGYGAIDELCTYCTANPGTNPDGVNSGCLLSGELNSTWMQINVVQGGTLEFSLGTPGSGFLCFDWAMWDYTPSTCSNIFNNTQAPASCNWNGSCDGFTGMGSPMPAGGIASNFQPEMTVSAGDQFVIMLSNYSSAYTNVPLDFFGTADISCTPLPVEMMGFSGENYGAQNILNWSTAMEIHNARFDVERSADGVSFAKIGEIQGAGNTTSESNYRFVDNSLTENMYYYRLKQVDFDGAYKYSDVIAIATTGDNHFKVVSAFPNPATDVFNVHLFMDHEDVVSLKLSQANGRAVYSTQESYNRGSNHITVPVSGLAKGVYLLTIFNEGTNSSEIIKLVID